jgi:hypothetical protein
LSLSSIPLRWYHHAAGENVSHFCSIIQAHQMEAKVDSDRRARRGEDLTLIYVKHAGIDLDGREPVRERFGVHSMGGSAPAVEQTRMGQDEGARTKGGYPSSAPVSLPQAL